MAAFRKLADPPALKTASAPVFPVRDTVHFPGVIQTLLIGREMSLKALHSALRKERHVVVLGQRDQTVEEPRAADLYRVGTLSEILHVLPLPDATMRVVLRGLDRVEVSRLSFRSGLFTCDYLAVPLPQGQNEALEALMRECLNTFQDVVSAGLQLPLEVMQTLPMIEDASMLADTIAHHLPTQLPTKQSLLETLDVGERMNALLKLLVKERQVLDLQASLRSKVEQELGQTQREYFLREQMKAIQHELSHDEVLSEEGEGYRRKIEACGMPEATRERAMVEVRRLERAPTSSPEGMVIRNYLDWLVSLPWTVVSEDRIDVKQAGQILDRDHYGLEAVKNRILDYLAVRQLNPALRGPILCFVGPPGVGKTSIGRSIAESLGRSFLRLSLGGVRDEAEIRGHRRTYIGSMPGRLIQGIRTCGTRNPVFMLDEIDKMTSDYRGDPTSALLEALDPEQNAQFGDHYIEATFDLSSVMFIATANLLENIPPALRDRMEVIPFPSYTEHEKLAIAKDHLMPKKLKEHGLTAKQMQVGAESLQLLIREYTREAGVRSLEREIATLCRKVARRIAEQGAKSVSVSPAAVREMLGKPRFRYGHREDHDEVGAATGMVYSEYGGDVITIEANLMPPFSDQPEVRLTGSLGDVMKESALAAVTYVRARQNEFHQGSEFRHDVHVHVPEGAVPKDGPSAGVTILTALVSAFTGRPVRRDVAMTGEITLRGKVLPVGGIREKVLAAHRAGILEVIVPSDNLRDLDDLPGAVREAMRFHLVDRVEQAIDTAIV